MLRTATPLLLAGIALAHALQPAQPSPPFDVVIRNGRVMDGTGNPWLRADIGIRGDRIAAIEQIMRQPYTMTSSDGGLVLPTEGKAHPRD